MFKKPSVPETRLRLAVAKGETKFMLYVVVVLPISDLGVKKPP
jgi:hypothetical protein